MLSKLAWSTWSAGRPWQMMLFCMQTGASCIIDSPLGEFLEPETLSSKMQETQEGVTPPSHRLFLSSLLCCMLLGMGGSLCVRPWCHCWTNSNSVEMWIPFFPSTALHTIAPPPNRIRLSLLHEVLQKYIPLGFSPEQRARTPSVLSL